MDNFLILKLCGPMQAWGGHTYEDYRPTQAFPTRSGILGLLGACMGIQRKNRELLLALNASILMAVRADRKESRNTTTITDFHTVQEARKVDGKTNPNPVVSRREYLCDAEFTVALRLDKDSPFTTSQLIQALKKPIFTPFLGRRSCPLARPIFETEVEANNLTEALSSIEPCQGIIYSEQTDNPHSRMIVRDVPMRGNNRQFATRQVHIQADT